MRFVCSSSQAYGALLLMLTGSTAVGELHVQISPPYDPWKTTGLRDAHMYGPYVGNTVSSHGLAVGTVWKYEAGEYLGFRGVRFGGGTSDELDPLGPRGDGWGYAVAYSINDAGIAVGYATQYAEGEGSGNRAVRWDAESSAITELQGLGVKANGESVSTAVDINNHGIIAGFAVRYEDGAHKGLRAVVWDSAGQVRELGHLPKANNGPAYAFAINDAGVAVGASRKYGTGGEKGQRAVRWDAAGNATELASLGTDADGKTQSEAIALSENGHAVGWAQRFDTNGNMIGEGAARWKAGTAAVDVLGHLGTSSTGFTESWAYDINSDALAVGWATKYDESGVKLGTRAVRWFPDSTRADELAVLEVHTDGTSYSVANSVNDQGTIVGASRRHFPLGVQRSYAVAWLPDGTIVDLNELGVVHPESRGTWLLTSAKSLSENGWVAGEGTFDPDNDGPAKPYPRLWVAQIGLGGDWTNISGSGNAWDNGSNWSTGTPAIQRVARFTADATYTVGFGASHTARGVELNAGHVTFALGSNALTLAESLVIAPAATLASDGTLIADVTSAGTLAPGNSPGTLKIDGDLLSNGVIELEVAGESLHDRLVVTGQASIDGVVRVLLNYTPQAGATFDLLDWATFVDRGYELDLSAATLPGSLQWDISAFASEGVVSVVPEPGVFGLLLMSCCGLLRRRQREDCQPGSCVTFHD